MMHGSIWVRFSPTGVRHVIGELGSTMCGLGVPQYTPRVDPHDEDVQPCRDCRKAVRRRIDRLADLERAAWGEH